MKNHEKLGMQTELSQENIYTVCGSPCSLWTIAIMLRAENARLTLNEQLKSTGVQIPVFTNSATLH